MARDIKEVKKFVHSLRGLSEKSKNKMVREYLDGRDFTDAIEQAKLIGIERERERLASGEAFINEIIESEVE